MIRKKKSPKRDSGTRSRVSKKPWKSREHLNRVKAHGCLMAHRGSDMQRWCNGPIDPHHCRKLLPSGLLPRSDALVVPLCRLHHGMMDGDERKRWKHFGIDPAAWIASFSEEGRLAIEALRKDGP